MSDIEKIAVFADTNGTPSDFYTAEKIYVYFNEDNGSQKWSVKNTITLDSMETDSIAKIRGEATKRLALIEDCNVVVAKEISGIPFTVFDLAGIRIFTSNEISSDLLSEIIDDIKSAEGSSEALSLEPIETKEGGFYYMDLALIQSKFPDMSSKKLLKGFLENTPFMELNLKCGHIPPWIENSGLYDIKQQSTKDYTIALITKKQCNL